ncbi:MAG: 23S rRNA (guanosine(2251)-2'-O)-methyltransferase RlmB [Pseudomonadota bacterium]
MPDTPSKDAPQNRSRRGDRGPSRGFSRGAGAGSGTGSARRGGQGSWQGRPDRINAEPFWLFGLHAVRDALENPSRDKRRLLVTPNAQQKLAEAIARAGIEPEIQDPRRFGAPLDPQSVHQGAALETVPLVWGTLEDVCAPRNEEDRPRVLLLDRVTDPHNVGAILRSAEVFGARAVIAPVRHSAPETGALAKSASGALERQPYLRVKNLGTAMETLKELGYVLLGLDGEARLTLDAAAASSAEAPVGLALGAEGPGLRDKTKGLCDELVAVPSASAFASLNVSNAAAIALYATRAGTPSPDKS